MLSLAESTIIWVLQSSLFPPFYHISAKLFRGSCHLSNKLPSLYFMIRDERKLSNKTDTSIQDSPTEQGRNSYMCWARSISSSEMSSPPTGGYNDFLMHFLFSFFFFFFLEFCVPHWPRYSFNTDKHPLFRGLSLYRQDCLVLKE
jgi:hypothetical protein